MPRLDLSRELQTAVEAARAVLAGHLQEHESVAAGETTIADFSLAGYMFYPESELSFSWSDYPAMAAWLGRIRAMPNWVDPYDLMPTSA